MHLKSETENAMKDNMRTHLASKIQDFSRTFRVNEEKYMKNYQELVGDQTKYNLSDDSLAQTSQDSNSHLSNDFLQIEDNSTKVLRRRDDEISTLLSSITELASVFKDMQTMVVEQGKSMTLIYLRLGTILDRIDYNIDNALQNTKTANTELKKADEAMKSSCFRNSIVTLIVAIFVMSVLVLYKVTK